jgi:hypothetical protein
MVGLICQTPSINPPRKPESKVEMWERNGIFEVLTEGNLKEKLLLGNFMVNGNLILVLVINFIMAFLISIKFISNFVDLEIDFHCFIIENKSELFLR